MTGRRGPVLRLTPSPERQSKRRGRRREVGVGPDIRSGRVYKLVIYLLSNCRHGVGKEERDGRSWNQKVSPISRTRRPLYLNVKGLLGGRLTPSPVLPQSRRPTFWSDVTSQRWVGCFVCGDGGAESNLFKAKCCVRVPGVQ